MDEDDLELVNTLWRSAMPRSVSHVDEGGRLGNQYCFGLKNVSNNCPNESQQDQKLKGMAIEGNLLTGICKTTASVTSKQDLRATERKLSAEHPTASS